MSLHNYSYTQFHNLFICAIMSGRSKVVSSYKQVWVETMAEAEFQSRGAKSKDNIKSEINLKNITQQ